MITKWSTDGLVDLGFISIYRFLTTDLDKHHSNKESWFFWKKLFKTLLFIAYTNSCVTHVMEKPD